MRLWGRSPLLASVILWTSPALASESRPASSACGLVGSVAVASVASPDVPASSMSRQFPSPIWRPLSFQKPVTGMYWLRLVLANPGQETATCVIIPPRFAPLAELFPWGQDSPVARTGWLLPLGERAMKRALPALPLSLPPGETRWLVKITVPPEAYPTPRDLQLEVQNLDSFYTTDLRSNHLNGIYGGIMVAVVLYNLFLFLSLRERLYLHYVLYASCFGLIWLVRAGMALTFLWPSWPRWDAQAGFFFIGLAIVAANAFTSDFLGLPQHLRRGHRALVFLSAVALLCLLGGALQLYSYVEIPLALVTLSTCGVAVALALRRLRAGSSTAKIYLAATGTLLLGTAIYTLAFLGALPTNLLTANAAQVGSAVEMIMLAFALGDRIAEMKHERQEAERAYVRKMEADVAEKTRVLRLALAESRQAHQIAESARRELESLNLKLAELALTDPLTGLANRRRLDQVLDEEWRRAFRQGSYLAVVLVDVDYFKSYNDHLGHQAGDELLKILAAHLQTTCRRPGDLAARYGGEEFALVLPGLSPELARQLAEGLHREVVSSAWPHPASPLGPYVTISCGVAAGKPGLGVEPRKLLSHADEALYVAKGSGRNRVHLRPVGSGELRVVDG